MGVLDKRQGVMRYAEVGGVVRMEPRVRGVPYGPSGATTAQETDVAARHAQNQRCYKFFNGPFEGLMIWRLCWKHEQICVLCLQSRAGTEALLGSSRLSLMSLGHFASPVASTASDGLFYYHPLAGWWRRLAARGASASWTRRRRPRWREGTSPPWRPWRTCSPKLATRPPPPA